MSRVQTAAMRVASCVARFDRGRATRKLRFHGGELAVDIVARGAGELAIDIVSGTELRV